MYVPMWIDFMVHDVRMCVFISSYIYGKTSHVCLKIQIYYVTIIRSATTEGLFIST